jgi:hypothetical protein
MLDGTLLTLTNNNNNNSNNNNNQQPTGGALIELDLSNIELPERVQELCNALQPLAELRRLSIDGVLTARTPDNAFDLLPKVCCCCCCCCYDVM